MTSLRKFTFTLLICILWAAPVASIAQPALARSGSVTSLTLDPGTRFYIPLPNRGDIKQIARLISSGNKADAVLIGEMITTPQAVWFTSGSPKKVMQEVKTTVQRANGIRTVPILVAYNLPFRDCSQYSAGGAASPQEYQAWIDGFAAGIGDKNAVVILEPDGLGIIPWYKQFRGTPAQAADYEWCQPADADEGTAADDRFAMLNYAVDAFKAHPNVRVYLDGTHSAWLGSGDAAHRLIQAGVERADGFFLNVSNYQYSDRLVKYGQWVSDCIYLLTNSWWHVEWCASQYYPANPSDLSTWA